MSQLTDAQMKFDFNLLDALPVKVSNLANDSRQVQVGDTFLAYPGEHGDGRTYIPQAIERQHAQRRLPQHWHLPRLQCRRAIQLVLDQQVLG